MVKYFVEEPANSSSTLKTEAEGICEMLVPVYKRLRRLVPRIPQYFNCCRNFRFYKGRSEGKFTCNYRRTERDWFTLRANTLLFSTFISCGTRPTVLTAHLHVVASLKHVQLNYFHAYSLAKHIPSGDAMKLRSAAIKLEGEWFPVTQWEEG